MADTITSANSPTSCVHFVIGGTDESGAWSGLQVTEADLQIPLTAEEKTTLRLLLARTLRQKGVTLAQFANRVLRGEEATNVKVYDLIAPGVAISKTNIGTAYVNISPRLNGERTLIDFTGCTQYRLVAFANFVGTGPFGMRVVRDSDNAVLFENANLAQTGERELDTDWQTLPAQAAGLIFVRVQAKSIVAADDPVFGAIRMAVR
jgi:hypothetical protein